VTTIGGRHEHWPTPRSAVQLLLPHLPRCGPVLEPSAGDGALLEVLLAEHVGAPLHAVELHKGRHSAMAERFGGHPHVVLHRGNFLRWAPPVGGFPLVVGNPPFKQAERFARRCLELAAPVRGTVALLLPLAFLASARREAFHDEHPSDLVVVSRRPRFDGKGTGKRDVAWFVWGPGRGDRILRGRRLCPATSSPSTASRRTSASGAASGARSAR
jgi:hypothetical protein